MRGPIASAGLWRGARVPTILAVRGVLQRHQSPHPGVAPPRALPPSVDTTEAITGYVGRVGDVAAHGRCVVQVQTELKAVVKAEV